MQHPTEVVGTVEIVPPPSQETAETPTPPTYVTKEELEKAVAETLRREKQSNKDLMSRIDGKLNDIKSKLEAGGAQLTPQQVTVLRSELEQSEEQQEQVTAAPETPAALQEEPNDPVVAEIMDIFKAEGVSIEPSDPEFTPLDAILKDPNGNMHLLRKELFKQIEAKKLRVATNTEQAGARVIDTQQPSGEATVSNARGYWNRAHE